MNGLQFDLFADRSPLSAEEAHILRLEIQNLIESASKVRRGVFARLGEQSKLILKLYEEIEELKRKKSNNIIPLEGDTLFTGINSDWKVSRKLIN